MSIKNPAPDGWYNYAVKRWANIVTINNGLKTYWTYIPRFEYGVESFGFTNVRFIKSTQTTPTGNYKIPDSFTFDGKALKGYWISKYRVQE